MSSLAQGEKVSGLGTAGGGSEGTRSDNPSQAGRGVGAAASRRPEQETTAAELGKTLPSEFSLANTKADAKGHEHTMPNPEANDPELNTAGRGGDEVQIPVHSHDIDLPAHAPHAHPMANETRANVQSGISGSSKFGDK
ncbi:hypothetical protein CBOM_01741 [Ceraceosorus bombacis]|uniref:Uncharacterized protein n=1 Tax=Ceraceosorus bombacis TaxID=401625 RepID=A0A0P1BD49_9BASI|nr:hypothetical protein CBOM_01741 [Ceraceosorus bombacis]